MELFNMPYSLIAYLVQNWLQEEYPLLFIKHIVEAGVMVLSLHVDPVIKNNI